jgi:hypothetical protein
LKLALAVAAAMAAAAAYAQEPGTEEHALSPQGVAGEIMDIAVQHCRNGERAQALALFEAIRRQLDPPPAILRLILDLERTGCDRAPLASGAALRLQVSSGWDSNVSQGISARTLVLGSGDNTIELELDPSYRPRSSAFVQTSVDYSLILPRYGTSVQFALGQRKNIDASQFDLRTFSAAAAKEFPTSWGTLRGQIEGSKVWLGERSYQYSENVALQWIRQSRSGAWLGKLSTTGVQYLTQPLQNATLWELGLLREWRIDGRRSVNVGFALQHDDAHGARPGGDRKGYQLQAGGVMLADGWRIHSQLSYTSWKSDSVFAPGLLDVRRHNRLWQTMLSAERPLAPNTTLSLEWRGRWASDTIVLYKYQGQMVSATFAFRF